MPVFEDVPALCGHRGSGRGVVGGHRENTLGSCVAAVAAGVRWVEVDARLTADGVLVANHNPRGPDGRFLADLPASETDALGLTRIEDLLDALPAHVGVDLEVKTAIEDALRPRERTTAAAVASLAARERARRPLLLTSFDPAAMAIFAEQAPGVPAGLLTWRGFPLRKAIPAAVHLGAQVIAAQFTSFPLPGTPAERMERGLEHAVSVAHRAGLELAAWCPPPAEQAQLAAAGVDCIIVDDVPARLAQPRPAHRVDS